jgi:glycosyltransferase involved in cell wall biosynthesis
MLSHDASPATPRIAYVVKRYPRYSETFIVNEILAHEAAGAQLEIFSLRAPEDTHFQDILAQVRAPVTYLPDRVRSAYELWLLIQASAKACPGIWTSLPLAAGIDSRELGHALALAAHVATRGITHLHAHFASSSASVARLAAHFAGISYSFTAHAKDIFHESVDAADLRAKLRDASAVVTVSDFNLRHFQTEFPDCSQRVHRIYNGIDLTRFSYQDPQPGAPLILAVGRLVEKKGFDDLIDACAMLAREGTAFSCLIVGSGEEEDALRQRIARLGLQDKVRLEGPRPQREVIELMRRATLMAAPCIIGADGNRDGLPTVLLEAMALGLPCVATDVTGIPEVVRDGETGLCIRQAAPENLAGAMATLLADADQRLRLARNARQLIEAEFDVHRNAARVFRLFETAGRARLEVPA